MTGKASKLINDLSNVPSIVGGLGLGIAEAQKAFNLDYMDNIERLLGLIKSLLDPKSNGANVDPGNNGEFIKSMLKQLAPSRYQFTETTLAVNLDLAQTMDAGGSAGFSGGLGAVAVNAAMSVGYGYDYRAAAEVRATIHAIPPDQTTLNTLLGRAKEINDKALTLPPGAQIDSDLVDKSHTVLSKLIDQKIDKPTISEDEANPVVEA